MRKDENVVTSVSMRMQGECISACVFILAAGIGKQVSKSLWLHQIGIHRPFLTTQPTGSVDSALKSALYATKAYLAEMNIPEQLADDMFNIAPSEVKILTDDELSRYRLNNLDIAWLEKTELRGAQLAGMSRQDYIRNKALALEESKKCFAIKDLTKGRQCIANAYRSHGFKVAPTN